MYIITYNRTKQTVPIKNKLSTSPAGETKSGGHLWSLKEHYSLQAANYQSFKKYIRGIINYGFLIIIFITGAILVHRLYVDQKNNHRVELLIHHHILPHFTSQNIPYPNKLKTQKQTVSILNGKLVLGSSY